MDLELFIGITAATLTTIAFVPQVAKAHITRHTKDLSLVMYILFSIGITLWMTYGFLLNSGPIIIANGITLIMSLYILFLKMRHG